MQILSQFSFDNQHGEISKLKEWKWNEKKNFNYAHKKNLRSLFKNGELILIALECRKGKKDIKTAFLN